MTTLPDYVTDGLTEILDEIGSLTASRSGGFTLAHDIAEGHEHDHGDEQDTVITLRVGDTTETWTYQLPADPDGDGTTYWGDGTTYWQAFEAADDMIAAWMQAHGVTDPTVDETHTTGWSIDIPRGTWKPTALDRVRAATAEKSDAESKATAKLWAWRGVLADADRDRSTDPGLKVEDICRAAGVTREGFYKALRTHRGGPIATE